MKYLAAIDVGTTNCKTIIFNTKGQIVSSAYREFSNIVNRLGSGWVEQDAIVQWKKVCDTAKEAIIQSQINPKRIKGIGVTTLRQSILPVDEDGNPLRYAILWGVKATYPQAESIKKEIGERTVYEITGLTINSLWGAPSIIYIIQNEPEVYKKTYKFLEIQDFLLYKLGSKDFVSDYSQASCLLLFDIWNLKWSKKLCNTIGIPIQKLPSLVPSGTIVGEISKEAAELTGFMEGTPLVVGGGDTQTSALGCGVITRRTANVVIGTSAVANAFLDKPVLDPRRVLVCHPHSYPGKYVLDHNTLTGGNAYRWFRDNFCPTEKVAAEKAEISSYEIINAKVASVPAGANGVIFLPHFVGAASPYWNDYASGGFLGITLSTNKSDIAKSIIEGICLEIRKGFELMSDLGIEIDEIRVSGGACRPASPWNQIQADVYGKSVLVMRIEDTTALGAAILTGVALGIFKDIPEAVQKMTKISQEIKPNMKNYEKYTKLLELQDSTYRALNKAKIYNKIEKLTRNFYKKVSQ